MSFLLAIAILCSSAAAAGVWDRSPGLPYAEGITYFNEVASRSSLLTIEQIGHSRCGLPMAAVVVSRAPRREQTIRVLVICRQHGHEPGSDLAAAQVIEAWRGDTDPKTLRRLERVAFIFVPYANPDGAMADMRGNANGVDLNRDWQARTQPETQAVEGAFCKWQPHMVLDCHVFNPKGPSNPWYGETRNLLEAYQRGDRVSSATRKLQRALARRLNLAGYPVRESFSGPGFKLSLAHRHYAVNHGAPSLLYECGHGRERPFTVLFQVTLAHLGDERGSWKEALDDLRGLRAWEAPERRNEPIALPRSMWPARLRYLGDLAYRGDKEERRLALPIAGIAGGLLMILAACGLRRRRRSR